MHPAAQTNYNHSAWGTSESACKRSWRQCVECRVRPVALMNIQARSENVCGLHARPPRSKRITDKCRLPNITAAKRCNYRSVILMQRFPPVQISMERLAAPEAGSWTRTIRTGQLFIGSSSHNEFKDSYIY